MTSAGIVLAAGASRRMGTAKQLLPVGGRPLLEIVVAAACASRLDHVVVVLGANADVIAAGVDLRRARVVLNERWAEGMSTSLQAGIAALDAGVDRAVVILGDQPSITPDLLDRLLGAHSHSGLPAAALSVDGLLHPPVVLGRELWLEVMALRGDTGLRDVLRARRDMVAAVRADMPLDIDTPEDLARLDPT